MDKAERNNLMHLVVEIDRAIQRIRHFHTVTMNEYNQLTPEKRAESNYGEILQDDMFNLLDAIHDLHKVKTSLNTVLKNEVIDPE